jgi:hypothetical protein
MGSDEKTTQTNQSSTTNPWAPATPLLQNILGSLGGISTAQTPEQTAALAKLQGEAGSAPDLSAGETGAVTNALGTSTAPQQGMLGTALTNYGTNIGADASGANLDPYKTPGFGDALGTLTNDITNQVKGVYAGSGRDPSGAGSFAGSLGRGLMQGEAPVIQSQYNTNKQNQLSSASNLYNAAGQTAGGLTQQQLAQLQAQFQGLQGGASLPGILTQPGTTALGAANAAESQPLSNISGLEGLVNSIAGLGGQSTGTGTSTTSQSKSLLSNITGGLAGLGGLNGALGSGWLGSLGSSLGPLMALSDERVKEDIEPVGETHDGQTLYSYHYIGDSEPRVGLLAQEVEKRDPGAVVKIGGEDGIRAVNYSRALAKSRQIGMLKMAA